jgi:hypothetical protein
VLCCKLDCVYGNSCVVHLVVTLCVFVVLAACCTVCCVFVVCVVVVRCICWSVYLLYCVLCICYTVSCDVFPLDAGLLARGQYSEGPVTGHLDTGFSWSLSKCSDGSQHSQLPLHASHVALRTYM